MLKGKYLNNFKSRLKTIVFGAVVSCGPKFPVADHTPSKNESKVTDMSLQM